MQSKGHRLEDEARWRTSNTLMRMRKPETSYTASSYTASSYRRAKLPSVESCCAA